nr:hypothetical protein [Pseudomonas sp. NY11382]
MRIFLVRLNAMLRNGEPWLDLVLPQPKRAYINSQNAGLDDYTVPVGAGVPANTGAAGARHRVACFAGKPAPTMNRTGFSNFEKDSCTCIKRVEQGSGAWAENKKGPPCGESFEYCVWCGTRSRKKF